jgi:hypothetical protein
LCRTVPSRFKEKPFQTNGRGHSDQVLDDLIFFKNGAAALRWHSCARRRAIRDALKGILFCSGSSSVHLTDSNCTIAETSAAAPRATEADR